MRNFNKKITIIYILFIIYLLIGKVFIQNNLPQIYDNFYQPFFLIFLSFLSYKISKDTKKNNKYKKDLLETITIIMMIYIILYFTSGLLFTYVRSPYNHSLIGIIKNIWIYIVVILFEEYIRYTLIKNSGNKKRYFIFIGLLFLILEVNFSSFITSFKDNETIFKYISSIIIPCICHSFLSNYLVQKGDYKTSITYLLPLKLMVILLPIYPNLDWFFSSLYEIILAIIIYVFAYDFYEKKILRIRKRKNQKSNIVTYFPYLIFFIVFGLFIAGVFSYKPVAIVSNSMYPKIKRGDIVISKKIEKTDLKNIRLYDIIEYRLDNSVIVHRVIAIDFDQKGNLVFITKGDNNKDKDPKKVTEDQVLGLVKIKVPKVGYPTVWLNDFFKNSNKPDVEMGNGD